MLSRQNARVLVQSGITVRLPIVQEAEHGDNSCLRREQARPECRGERNQRARQTSCMPSLQNNLSRPCANSPLYEGFDARGISKPSDTSWPITQTRHVSAVTGSDSTASASAPPSQ